MNVPEVIENARSIIKNAAAELDTAEIERDESDFGDFSTIQRVFIGNSLYISPSGKFYLPFACSNLEECPVCNGAGAIDNPHYNNALSVQAREIFHSGKYDQHEIRALCSMVISICENPAADCPFCGGLGSREAYLDQIFFDTMDEEADKIGAFIERSEGDPLYMYLSRIVAHEQDGD